MDWPLVDCYCCRNHTHRGTQAHGGMAAPTAVPEGHSLLPKGQWPKPKTLATPIGLCSIPRAFLCGRLAQLQAEPVTNFVAERFIKKQDGLNDNSRRARAAGLFFFSTLDFTLPSLH